MLFSVMCYYDGCYMNGFYLSTCMLPTPLHKYIGGLCNLVLNILMYWTHAGNLGQCQMEAMAIWLCSAKYSPHCLLI